MIPSFRTFGLTAYCRYARIKYNFDSKILNFGILRRKDRHKHLSETMFVPLIASIKRGINQPPFYLRMMMLLVLAPAVLMSRPLPRGHHAFVQKKTSQPRIFGSPLSGNLYARNRLGLRLSGKRIPWGSIQSPNTFPGIKRPITPPPNVISPPNGVTDFHVIANIDHDDILIISPTFVQWDHQPGGARPGQHAAINMKHTELNGFRWFPTWPPPASSTQPALSGQLSTNLYSGLVTSGRQVVFNKIIRTNNGGAITPPKIIQQPTKANSYTLKIHFEDKDANGPELFNVTFGLQ